MARTKGAERSNLLSKLGVLHDVDVPENAIALGLTISKNAYEIKLCPSRVMVQFLGELVRWG